MRSAIDGMMLMLCRPIPHRNIRCVSIPAVVVYAAMKRLLLLTFMAVASEAIAHQLAVRARTRRDGRYNSSLRAIRSEYNGTARHIGARP